jgi:hypothetical protein
MKKIISEFELIPKWYGVAYRDYSSLKTILYPIPINLIISAVRSIYFRLINTRSLIDRYVMYVYEKGFDKGLMVGMNEAKNLEDLAVKVSARILSEVLNERKPVQKESKR